MRSVEAGDVSEGSNAEEESSEEVEDSQTEEKRSSQVFRFISVSEVVLHKSIPIQIR